MKILLVDDSKSARYALRLQLQKQGAEVEMAESAEAAFETLKGELPDAILMDHMMPGLNGFEALEVIRDDPRTAAIPVIMCTSHEEPEFVATAQKKGVFGILPKSAAPELLPEMMARLQAELSTAVRTPAPTPAPAPVAEKPAAPPPGLSEDAIIRLFESRLEERLPRLLSPMVDELRRDLSEVVLSETRRLIEERQAAEQSARQAVPTMADLQAISTRLATETLPDLIKRALQTERVQLQEWVDKRVGESLAQTTASEAQERSDADEIARKAVAMARRESKEAVEAALATAQQSIQSLEQRLPSLGPIYALIVLAIVLGLGAAGAVYSLLAPM
ncbi:response regulator [Allochromatium vinosum]|uniref:Response regulator receiver protein n=1 Tax=Allochromatium vinosum (strain ATCC 17899 / DSM 180 / NBRC 103801 / NCIMB 10441 / D) TaxID=572477 RepID=D3RNR0_ALLVD|nr:response regulator [Allochromatium vinosum]ADC61420.1 response regulator receiver protein [Allochromatium vinosum DSM 180]